MYCSKEVLQLQRVDVKGKSALHRACGEGNKEEVLTLLHKLKEYKILKEELLRHDKTGRTPLCLARAEKKQEWNDNMLNWEVESHDSFKSRADTATAMLEWIQKNNRDILEQVKKRLV